MEAGLQNRIIENNILKLMIRFFSKYIFSLYKFNRNSFKKFRSIYFSKIDNENIKIIFTLPRSGTHILYGVLSSYLEQIYNKGNGIPKFFDEALLSYNIPNYPTLISNDILSGKTDLSKDIYKYFIFSHHPIQTIDLINFEKLKPIILIRDPLKATLSAIILYLHHRVKTNDVSQKNLNKYIQLKANETMKYLLFWSKQTKNYEKNDQKYLLLYYEKLVLDIPANINRILEFYNFPIKKKELEIALENNKEAKVKDTILRYNKNNLSLQFSNLNDQDFKKKIENQVFDIFKEKKLNVFGYKF